VARRIKGLVWRGKREGKLPEPYIAMAAEVLQELDLAQGTLGQNFLAEDIGDLLDGDALICLVVNRGAV
jgi:hypothetical protein